MNNQERFRRNQTRAEANNLLRRIHRLRRSGQVVPTTLFDRSAALEQTIQANRWGKGKVNHHSAQTDTSH